MAGYTPLFDTLTRGTLCGRWPDIGLWPIVLSLADKNGEVDVTPLYIAGITGLPVDEVVACMARFCEPDPYSRSTANEGRRLELLDDHRDWGWLVVNHTKYREKARKIAHDQRRQESGQNAERMRARREKETREDPTRPDATRNDPPSNANTNTNTEKDSTARPAPASLNANAWTLYLNHRRELKAKRLTDRGAQMAMAKLAELPTDEQLETVELSIANGWTGLFPEKRNAAHQRSNSFAVVHARNRRAAGLD